MATRNPPRSDRDLATPRERREPDLHSGPVGALGLERPVVVSSDATMQTAAQAMLRAGRSAVVVGSWTVVTDHDIARAVALGRPPTTPAAAISSQDGLVLPASTTMSDAVAAMLRAGSRDAIVVDDDHAVSGTVELDAALGLLLGGPDVPEWLSCLRGAMRERDAVDDVGLGARAGWGHDEIRLE
jgi:signal-transduction protein with cAMP-binding, CBS, and nucleotidyltransferase domain